MSTIQFFISLVFAGSALLAQAQTPRFVISTVAGVSPLPNTPAPALSVSIGSPSALAADTAGNVYFASSLAAGSQNYEVLFKLDQSGILTRTAPVMIAGARGQSGDAQLPLASAELYDPGSGGFSATADMTTPRFAHTAVLLNSGQVLILGGSTISSQSSMNALSSAELYTPAAPIPAPVLFSLSGDDQRRAAIWHSATGAIVSASNAAIEGEALAMDTVNLASNSVIPPQISVGGKAAKIHYFGDAPGYPGYFQVNFQVPSGVVAGNGDTIRLTYLGRSSNAVTIATH
jgi:hypothetical protein